MTRSGDVCRLMGDPAGVSENAACKMFALLLELLAQMFFEALIDVSRGNQGAINYVDGLTEPWFISRVTALELIVGARDKRDLLVIDALSEVASHMSSAGRTLWLRK